MFPTFYIPARNLITNNTYITIYRDSSGSMNSSLTPLTTMVTTLLKPALLPFYNNDSALYDSRVTSVNFSDERTLLSLRFRGPFSSGDKAISFVFQDESSPYNWEASTAWNPNETRSVTYNTDIANFNSQVNAYPAGYYYGGVAAVNGYLEFQQAIPGIFQGLGSYSGTNGLSSRTSYMTYKNGVTAGGTASYYLTVFTEMMNDLGFYW